MDVIFQHIGTRGLVKWFLRIWIPPLLVLAVVLWLLYRAESNAQLAITRVDEQYVLQLASQTITSEMAMLRGDALYLAEQSSLHHWLDSGEPAALTRLAGDLLAFARHRGLYDQVRVLAEDGRELVRIDWNRGQPEIVPDTALQDKSDRYYVHNILALDKGALYFSPFDLNIEQNHIEQPVKPMIRLGTPIYDHTGRKRGLIVLNYLGQRLLNQLRKYQGQRNGELWLLNAEGYWLLGPRPEMEWGFMYADRKAMRFEQDYGQVWAAMQSGSGQSQLLRPEGLFSFAWIEPESSPVGTRSEHWALVAYVPTGILAGVMAERTRSLVVAFIVLALLLAMGSGMLALTGMQRRQNEGRTRESEARFRGLLNSAPDAIVIVDQKGHISLMNTQAEKWFGYGRQELLGQPVERLLPERFRQRHIAVREDYTEKPVARPMGADIELFGLRKDGSEFPVEISLSPLQTGQDLLVTSVIRDISARRQAEQAQRQVQVRYQELVNNLPIGIYRNTQGADGHFLEVNPAMVAIFEAESAEELLAQPVCELYRDPADRKAFSEKLMEQGYVSGEELCLKTLHGREFFAAITAVKKRDSSGEIYFDGVVEDISERKESERHIRQLNDNLRARSTELEAINRELEAFSYSVSHDLRAPLRAMDGFSHLLLTKYADILDDWGKDRLKRVRAAAQHMAALIDDLLKLSRISRAELTWEPVDLSELARKAMQTLEQGDPQRRVQFQLQPDLITRGDPRLLQIVMDNLLGNAWKFTSQRADAMIEVGRKHDQETESVYFVRDNGAGFDMAYADKLFGAFQRLHDTNEFPGTGIGLATVQRVIHKHGGRIWAESAVGQGATFYFTFDGREKS